MTGAIRESPLRCESVIPIFINGEMGKNYEFNSDIHQRRSIRLKGYDYPRAGAYFITTCTRNRGHLFGKIENQDMILNDAGQIVANCWFDLPNHYENIVLDISFIMPNHFHGIIVFTKPVGAIHESPLQRKTQNPQMNIKQLRKMGLSKTIGRFKMVSSKQTNILRKTPGVPAWQRSSVGSVERSEIQHTMFFISKDKFLTSLLIFFT